MLALEDEEDCSEEDKEEMDGSPRQPYDDSEDDPSDDYVEDAARPPSCKRSRDATTAVVVAGRR